MRGFQFGLETLAAPGVVVSANRRIANGTFSEKRNNNIKKAAAEGHKSAIGTQRGKRWMDWKCSGPIGYTIMPYWYSMLLSAAGGAAPTATTPTGGYVYNYQMNSTLVDTPQTMTFEYGNNQGSNSRFGFGTMSDMTLKVNDSAVDYDCSGFGAYATKNITMTAAPTVLAPVLANMTDFRVNYATTFAGLSTGSPKLLTARDIELNVKSKYKSVFFIDDATISLGGILEKRPDVTGKVIVAEGTESDYFLAAMETQSSPVYLQLQGTGPLITAGTPNIYYLLKYTVAIFLNNEDETDDSDLFSGSYDFYSGEDTVNGDLTVQCITTSAAL